MTSCGFQKINHPSMHHEPLHKVHVAVFATTSCDFLEVNHPPVLTWLRVFLFVKLKRNLRETHFADEISLQTEVIENFKGKSISYFSTILGKLIEKYYKCINFQRRLCKMRAE